MTEKNMQKCRTNLWCFRHQVNNIWYVVMRFWIFLWPVMYRGHVQETFVRLLSMYISLHPSQDRHFWKQYARDISFYIICHLRKTIFFLSKNRSKRYHAFATGTEICAAFGANAVHFLRNWKSAPHISAASEKRNFLAAPSECSLFPLAFGGVTI